MAPLTTTQRRALVAVLVGALVLRLAWIVVAAREPIGFHDPAFYRYLAHQLARFDGYILEGRPTAYYPVGYPAVLGAAFGLGRLVGADGKAAETAITTGLNLVAGMVAVYLAFVLGRRCAGAWAGIAGAALVGAMPNLVFHTAVPLTETLFNALALGLVAVLAAAPWESSGPGRRRLVAAGVLLGAATLVRPVVLPVLGLLPAVWLVARLGWRRAVADVALLALAAAAVVAPWTIRNAVRMDAFVPISTNTGDNLCMSRQPGATGGFLLVDYCFAGPELEGLVRPEYETRRDARGRRLALEFVREHPGTELRLWLDRLGATFRHDHDGLDAVEGYGDDVFLGDAERDAYRRVADGAWYLLGPAGLAAAAAVVAVPRLRRQPRLVLLVVTIVGVLVPVVVFFGDARFKVPAVPFVAVLVPSVVAALRRASGAPAPPALSPRETSPASRPPRGTPPRR